MCSVLLASSASCHPEFLGVAGLELVYRLDPHELLEKALLLNSKRWGLSATGCGSGSLLLTGHVAFAKDGVQPRSVEDP